jgi:NitT/TauT family transport system permease protein
VGEFVAGERGLGYAILESQSTFNTPRVFAAILILGLLGTLLFFAVDVCERLLLPWHVSQRNQLPR